MKNTKRIVSPPHIPAPSFNYMVSPETIRRQHTKQPEKPRSLNILISEPSKQSHVNVFGKKKEKCQKEGNKTVESQKRLKIRHTTEQMDSSCSMKNIGQEHEMCEAQETIKSPLKAIDEEPTVKDVRVDNRNLKRQIDRKLPSKKNISSAASISPLKSSSRNNINANNIKESDSRCYLFKTSEKNNHSPSKSPESERYYDSSSSPAENEEKNSSASSVSRESSPLQSTADKSSESK